MVRATQLTRGERRRLMYVELKTGYSDNGPAWISYVRFSKTGRTIYFRDRELLRLKGGGGAYSNYLDVSSGEEFWVSGVKRRGSNRHWAGGGRVEVDADARAEYEELVAGAPRGGDV